MGLIPSLGTGSGTAVARGVSQFGLHSLTRMAMLANALRVLDSSRPLLVAAAPSTMMLSTCATLWRETKKAARVGHELVHVSISVINVTYGPNFGCSTCAPPHRYFSNQARRRALAVPARAPVVLVVLVVVLVVLVLVATTVVASAAGAAVAIALEVKRAHQRPWGRHLAPTG